MKNKLMRLMLDKNLYFINPDNITHIEYIGMHEIAINFIGKENRILIKIEQNEDYVKVMTHINSLITHHTDQIER